MHVEDKRRLAPIEVHYYCMLAGVKPSAIAEGWYYPSSASVELVHHGFIDRVIVDASFRVPPKESA